MQFIQPKRVAEANIQAELYRRLKELSITCYLEYKIKLINCTTSRRKSLRVDLLVLKNNKIVCLIEIKSHRVKREFLSQTKQIQTYLSLGIPFILCDNFNFEESIIEIKKLYDSFVL